MHPIFETVDYKKFLKEYSESRGFTYAEIAAAARVQKPYISAVLNGTNHLSEEQIFEIGQLFELHEDELEYLVLILRENRAATGRAIQKHLQNKVREMSRLLAE